jgi:hypothetical protein
MRGIGEGMACAAWKPWGSGSMGEDGRGWVINEQGMGEAGVFGGKSSGQLRSVPVALDMLTNNMAGEGSWIL